MIGSNLKDYAGRVDYFLSGFDGCCLNCPEEERKILCGSGTWCDRCLCLKGREYYRRNPGAKRGYCGIRKELLDELISNYREKPQKTLIWLDQLKREGIKIPRYVLMAFSDTKYKKDDMKTGRLFD